MTAWWSYLKIWSVTLDLSMRRWSISPHLKFAMLLINMTTIKKKQMFRKIGTDKTYIS